MHYQSRQCGLVYLRSKSRSKHSLRFVILVPLLFGLSCAQPKYETRVDSPVSTSSDKVTADCSVSFNRSGTCLTWQWLVSPASKVYGQALLKVFRPNKFDKTTVLVDPPSLPVVIPFMSSMGHGTSRKPIVNVVDTGTYLVTDLYFTMKGPWEIKIQILNGQEVADEAAITFIY